jgi:oligopeptide transport system substrate-binding protein
LKEWAHDESITLIKNPLWAGTDYIPAPTIEEFTNVFLESSAALAAYEAGELAYINPVPPTDIDRVRVDYADEFGVGPGTCTYYYGFNTEKAPFDDARVRRAFSQAIDREAVTFFLNGGQQVAGMFTRPDLIAAPNQQDYPDSAIFTDVEAAQAELQEYMDEMGMEELPPITLVHNESESHAALAEIVQQNWSENLGVDITIESLEWSVFLDLRTNDAPQIFRSGWCFDHPDAHNFLSDVARSDAGENGTNDFNWANEEFDALVDEAVLESDVEVRRDLYAQAEELLVKTDAALAPVYYYTSTYLLSPSLDIPFSNTGQESYAKWVIN